MPAMTLWPPGAWQILVQSVSDFIGCQGNTQSACPPDRTTPTFKGSCTQWKDGHDGRWTSTSAHRMLCESAKPLAFIESTSIYQHLPAFGEGASPASSSTSGMPSNGRVGIPWNTWIRSAQFCQYSDWKRCHALHVSLLCMLLSNAVIQRIGNSVYQCLMMSQVWHIKQTLKCESRQIWRTRSENIRNLQIVLQDATSLWLFETCAVHELHELWTEVFGNNLLMASGRPHSTCLNISHNLSQKFWFMRHDMMD